MEEDNFSKKDEFYYEVYMLVNYLTKKDIVLYERYYNEIKKYYCAYREFEFPNNRIFDYPGFSDTKDYGRFFGGDDPIIAIYLRTIVRNLNIKDPFVLNFTILETLLHELEHAYQFQFLDNLKDSKSIKNVDDYEIALVSYTNIVNYLDHYMNNSKLKPLTSKVIRNLELDGLSKVDMADAIKTFYNTNYNLDATERLAEINAYTYVRDMIKTYSSNEELFSNFNQKLNIRLARGYDYVNYKLLSPTYEYFKLIGLYSIIKDLERFNKRNKKNLSDYDRLLLGIPLEVSKYMELIESVVDFDSDRENINDYILERKK